LLRQAAAFHLKGGEPEKAAACLEQLSKLDPSDTATLARLVLLYSQVPFIFVLETTNQVINPEFVNSLIQQQLRRKANNYLLLN
jgi:hypothetical protein